MIVVDSSVLIAFFRGHQNPAVERLVHLETEGDMSVLLGTGPNNPDHPEAYNSDDVTMAASGASRRLGATW